MSPWRPLVGAARCPPPTLVTVWICRIQIIRTTIRGGRTKLQNICQRLPRLHDWWGQQRSRSGGNKQQERIVQMMKAYTVSKQGTEEKCDSPPVSSRDDATFMATLRIEALKKRAIEIIFARSLACGYSCTDTALVTRVTQW